MVEAIAGLIGGMLIGWVLRGVVVRWRWSSRSALRHSSSMPPPLPGAAGDLVLPICVPHGRRLCSECLERLELSQESERPT